MARVQGRLRLWRRLWAASGTGVAVGRLRSARAARDRRISPENPVVLVSWQETNMNATVSSAIAMRPGSQSGGGGGKLGAGRRSGRGVGTNARPMRDMCTYGTAKSLRLPCFIGRRRKATVWPILAITRTSTAWAERPAARASAGRAVRPGRRRRGRRCRAVRRSALGEHAIAVRACCVLACPRRTQCMRAFAPLHASNGLGLAGLAR